MFAERRKLKTVLSLLADILATLASLALSVWLRHMGGYDKSTVLVDYAPAALFVVPVWVIVFELSGCYERKRFLSRTQLTVRILGALILAHALLGMVAFFARALYLSRGVLLMFFPVNFAAVMLGRVLVELLFRSSPKRVLIVGTDAAALKLGNTLSASRVFDVVGYLGRSEGGAVPPQKILGDTDALEEVLRVHFPVEEVVFANGLARLGEIGEMFRHVEERGLTARVWLGSSMEMTKAYVDDAFGEFFLTLQTSPMRLGALAIKRAMDILGAMVGLFITAVLYPFIAAAIKLTSRGPVLFRQVRVGAYGRPFVMYKFRTMVDGADTLKDKLSDRNVMHGPIFKIPDDPRITRVGKFLRRFSLDELPQFWNVLKGDMSLVGTRPPTPEEVASYKNHHFKRLSMKPGITGIWQTSGRSDVTKFEDIVAMDIQYLRNWSLWLDIKLLLKTIPVVVMGRGAR